MTREQFTSWANHNCEQEALAERWTCGNVGYVSLTDKEHKTRTLELYVAGVRGSVFVPLADVRLVLIDTIVDASAFVIHTHSGMYLRLDI